METPIENPTSPYFYNDPMTTRRNKVLRGEEIEKATKELSEAMLAFLDLDEKEENIKIKKVKAHYRLNQARDAIHNLKADR